MTKSDTSDAGLLELISDLMCVCHGGAIGQINAAGARMLGAESAEHLLGRPLAAFAHPDFHDILDDGLHVLADAPEGVPLIFVRPDGRSVEMELKVQRLPDVEGVPQVAILGRDITERTRAAETLLRSEERYRRLVELALDFTCICNDGLISYINPAGLRLVGTGEGERLVGKPLADLVHGDYRMILAEGLEVLAEEDRPVPLKLLRLDGRAVDVEVKVMPLGVPGERVFMMEARDVSDHKRSAEALREREQRLQGIMDAVGEGIVVADEQGLIQSLNPAAQQIFGYEQRELIGRNLAALMPEREGSRHDGNMADYIRSGHAKVLGIGREMRGRRKDGTVFPLELNVTELRRGRERLFIGVVRDITERKRADEALRAARDELELRVAERTRDLERLTHETRQILNSAGEGIIGVNAQMAISFANPAAAAMTGLSVTELVGRRLEDLVADALPGSRGQSKTLPMRAALMRGLFREHAQMVFRRSNGDAFPAEFACAPIEEPEAGISGYVIVFRDITERLRNEERLRLAATVFERTSEAIIVIDANHQVTAINPAFSEITGYQAEDICGKAPAFLSSGLYDDDTYKAIWAAVEAGGRWEGELWSRRKNGEKYAERLAISAVAGAEGDLGQYVVLMSDITQRKLDEERIRYQANYDTLTGLPNRTLFLDRLQQAVATASRSGQRVGLMFIDLDGFKLINDTLGHDIGDRLLQEAGRRLQACIRAADTVARLGGDEFTIIMPDLSDVRNAPVVAQRIIDSLQQPFNLGGHEAFVSASIGITSFPEDAQDTHTLLKNADAAMYRAKEQGKATYQFFTQDLNSEVTERLVIKNGLSKALERAEFSLYYQPKVSLADGHITGVEALMRWRNPELGMVSPAKFIPVMEETGIIGPVGEWALEVACRQHRAWMDEGFPIRVAVNLSVRQLRQPGLVRTVAALLERSGIAPSGLELEITESMIMKDTENAVAILQELNEMGIHIAMDDFGTGYSSLSYLKRFPLHTIKIDRSFVRDIATDQDDHEIIKTIISMGHSLRRRIVAEGVETEEQRDILERLHCDEIQGYLISPPVPAPEVTRLLREQAATV